MIKAITFDFWNTLYKLPDDYTTSARRLAAINRELNNLGYEIAEEELQLAVKKAWQHAYRVQREEGFDIAPRGQVDLILTTLNLKLAENDWDKVYSAFTRVIMDQPPQTNNGVLETLPLLGNKYKLAVICNTGATPGKLLREIMKKDGIFEYFQIAVFSDELGWAKPNREIFAYTLRYLEVEASEAAHIGDDSSTDVKGANQIGMTSVWLAPRADESIKADYRISEIIELNNLF